MSEFSLAVQTSLHTVTKCTGLSTFSVKLQIDVKKINKLYDQHPPWDQ